MNGAWDLGRSSVNAETLLRLCDRPGRILVLVQNNPDPDAVASAVAIRELVRRHLKKRVTIGYGGAFGRAENRAMLKELRIDVRRVEPGQLRRYRTLCLVDTQPGAGNNALFTTRPADVAIDHHAPPKRPVHQPELFDVREDYGATATILYEYLLATGMNPSPDLATALLYGIESDTQHLGRDASPADIRAFQELVVEMDSRKLARIRRAPVPAEYFGLMRGSLTNAVVAGSTVITLLRGSDNPDIFAEVADMLLRLRGIRTSVCYGPCGGVIHLSARAVDARGNAGVRMKRVVSRIGTGGGHRSMAGGQVPITGDLEHRLHLVHARVLKHFAHSKDCHPLLPDENATPCENPGTTRRRDNQ